MNEHREPQEAAVQICCTKTCPCRTLVDEIPVVEWALSPSRDWDPGVIYTCEIDPNSQCDRHWSDGRSWRLISEVYKMDAESSVMWLCMQCSRRASAQGTGDEKWLPPPLAKVVVAYIMCLKILRYRRKLRYRIGYFLKYNLRYSEAVISEPRNSKGPLYM